MIEVVSAIIVKHGRILLQQRPPTKDFGFRWESPGGKVESSESHHQALRRELQEEIGIDVGELPAGQKAVWTGRFDNVVTRPDRADVLILFYTIDIRFKGEPTRKDGQPGLGWFLPDEMLCLDLSPANARARYEIVREVRHENARRLRSRE